MHSVPLVRVQSAFVRWGLYGTLIAQPLLFLVVTSNMVGTLSRLTGLERTGAISGFLHNMRNGIMQRATQRTLCSRKPGSGPISGQHLIPCSSLTISLMMPQPQHLKTIA